MDPGVGASIVAASRAPLHAHRARGDERRIHSSTPPEDLVLDHRHTNLYVRLAAAALGAAFGAIVGGAVGWLVGNLWLGLVAGIATGTAIGAALGTALEGEPDHPPRR
jgi:hypothetical protein